MARKTACANGRFGPPCKRHRQLRSPMQAPMAASVPDLESSPWRSARPRRPQCFPTNRWEPSTRGRHTARRCMRGAWLPYLQERQTEQTAKTTTLEHEVAFDVCISARLQKMRNLLAHSVVQDDRSETCLRVHLGEEPIIASAGHFLPEQLPCQAPQYGTCRLHGFLHAPSKVWCPVITCGTDASIELIHLCFI